MADTICVDTVGADTAVVQSVIDVAGLGAVDVYALIVCIEGASTTSPGIAGVHSHTGMAGRDAAGTQSCIECSDIGGVHSCTGMAGRDAAGRHSVTDTADPGVHAVIVCIGIGGAHTGIARVAVGCVAVCWVHTDCRGLDKAGTV